MPTKALLATDAIFVRHQELHEYETVFWIRFLELVSRSPSGNEYIQRLRVPTLELDQLANAKIFIILQASWKSLWPGWFCTSLNPTTAKDEDADVLRMLCEQIVD